MVLDSVHPVDHYQCVRHPHKVCQQKVSLQEEKNEVGFGGLPDQPAFLEA